MISLDALGIVTQDISRSVDFYSKFDLEFKSFSKENQHFEAVLPSGMRVMLDSLDLLKSINPDFELKKGNQVVLAFKLDEPGKVDNFLLSLNSGDIKVLKEPFDAFWGQRYASLTDFNGVQIDLFSDLGDS